MLRNNSKKVPYWRIFAMLPVLILGFISIIGTTGDNGDGNGDVRFEEEEPFSFDITIDNQDQFSLLGVNGEITITGDSGADSVMVTGVKRVQSSISSQDAIDHLQDLQIDWESAATEISVETTQPQDSAERNYTVDYTITLPQYFKIQVDSINAVVLLDSIDNDVAVNIANADVTLRNIHGSALVILVNGAIDGEVVLPLNGTIELSTATGNIQLAIPVDTSAEFSATTLFGNINVSNLVFQDELTTSTSLTGILGSGQGMISLNAMGDITVAGF